MELNKLSTLVNDRVVSCGGGDDTPAPTPTPAPKCTCGGGVKGLNAAAYELDHV